MNYFFQKIYYRDNLESLCRKKIALFPPLPPPSPPPSLRINRTEHATPTIHLLLVESLWIGRGVLC